MLSKAMTCALVVALAVFAAACGGSGGSGGDPTERVTLRLAQDLDTFDPHMTITIPGYQVQSALYDTLVTFRDGEPVPTLAESWKITPSGGTFKLRDDVTCADGTRLQPSDVAASFERYVDPRTNAPRLQEYLGPGPYRISSDNAAGTVTIRLGQPYGEMIVGAASIAVICPSGLKDPRSLARTPAGTGPYTLAGTVRGDHYTFKLRPGYHWGPDGADTGEQNAPRTLEMKVVESESTAANLLLTGGLDVGAIVGTDVRRLERNDALEVTHSYDYGQDFGLFNHMSGHATADLTVRKALSMLIDRDAWNQAANSGYGRPTTGPVNRNTPCYDPGTAELTPAFDPEGARRLLLDDGWKPGAGGTLEKNGQPLKVSLMGLPPNGAGTENIAQEMSEIGIDATGKNVELGTLIDRLNRGEFDMAIIPSSSSNPVPSRLFSVVLTDPPPRGLNFGRVDNPTAMQALTKARTAQAGSPANCAGWKVVQDSMIEQANTAALAQPMVNYATRKDQNLTYLVNGSFVVVPTLGQRAKDET